MPDGLQPTSGSTLETPMVNSTVGTPGVNQAQAQTTPTHNPDISGMMSQYEGRINSLMSEKDKAINERNQAISQLTELQSLYTNHREQTQSSLTVAANSAQQAIDRSTSLERELVQERARNAKFAALMERPHLAPYSSLIPDEGDEAKLKAVLDQLEQIRADDIKRSTSPLAAAPNQQQTQGSNPLANQNSTLQSLYGTRANMNPAFLSPSAPIPASSPAQMNPAASPDVVSAINQLYADARRSGTMEAFEDATRRASLLANSSNAAINR